MIGILAYGSLLADPGWEIKDHTDRIIRSVDTPFPVEYARRSRTRSGAPTLVPVQPGKGIPVQAAVIVLKESNSLQNACDILYRREIHRPGDLQKKYREPRGQNTDHIRIDVLRDFAGLDTVVYTNLSCNFEQIVDDTYDDHEKAELLSIAARESLTEETFYTCQDGIHYLDTARHYGVRTRLTDIYLRAILALSGHATDLATARVLLAKSKGIITE